MKQQKWFDRKFVFQDQQNIFPTIIDRLSGTPVRLADKISKMSDEDITINAENAWSIAENVGHLLDLEPLWMGRLEDILNNEKELRAADLQNRKTHQANHNDKNIVHLLGEFSLVRSEMVIRLNNLTEDEIVKSALHPRLKTPMRVMDLFLFVAEHDDHHLARISQIHRLLSEKKEYK